MTRLRGNHSIETDIWVFSPAARTGRRFVSEQPAIVMNYVFAALSLLAGLFFTLYTLAAQGSEFSLGLMFGVLLIANAALRLWAAVDELPSE